MSDWQVDIVHVIRPDLDCDDGSIRSARNALIRHEVGQVNLKGFTQLQPVRDPLLR
jgi:hypothetical protein